jgi:hypothetical protein
MIDVSYRVINREDDSFAVEVTKPGTQPQMAVGFATEAEADAWIAQDTRFREAADPFGTPTAHRRRGF